MPTISELPYEALVEEVNFLRHQLSEALADKAYYEELVRLLQHQRHAPKSEVHAKGQGTLFNEAEAYAEDDSEQTSDEAEKQAEGEKKPRKRGKPKRVPLPDHLPRVEKVIDIDESEKVCPHTGQPLIKIGEEVNEQLGVKPAEFYVIRTIRPKYVCHCPACSQDNGDGSAGEGASNDIGESAGADEQVDPLNAAACDAMVQEEPKSEVKIAPPPAQPIPKSFASPQLLAHIAVAKYCDALPLYRQLNIFTRHGVELCRPTLASWMIRCGELIRPLINLAREELLEEPLILCDETRMQVLKATGKKPTAKSYAWCFMSGGQSSKRIVLFEIGPGRGHEVPMRFLEGYVGNLHTDGYEAYETLASKVPTIRLIGDWIHVRRNFTDAKKALPQGFKGEFKLQPGLEMIGELFRIERVDIGPGASDEKILAIRDEKSRPLLERLKEWAEELSPTIRPKSLGGKALRYMLERWPKLTIFLADPRIGLDTNAVENAIRPFVMGRKNWLFADTLAGAEASAALYSLLEMAKLQQLNPYAYLEAVFTELPRATTADQVEALLPWNWKPPDSPESSYTSRPHQPQNNPAATRSAYSARGEFRQILSRAAAERCRGCLSCGGRHATSGQVFLDGLC